jgi:hypothetical protein
MAWMDGMGWNWAWVLESSMVNAWLDGWMMNGLMTAWVLG